MAITSVDRKRILDQALVKARNFDGIFGIRKPAGESSAKTVARVKSVLLKILLPPLDDASSSPARGWGRQETRRIHDALKVGHGGTLDPIATGVLVIGLGRGCKRLTGYLGNTVKGYRTLGRLGIAHDTYDRTGKSIEEQPWNHVTADELERMLRERFTGRIMQRPPSFSAIHVNGERAYEIARRQQQSPTTETKEGDDPLVLPEREITIHKCSLVEANLPDFTLEMECSSGTYVRSLIYDLGKALGTVSTMMELERTQQGSIHLDQCINVEDIQDLDYLEKHFVK